jgi:uncharacterized 2Fe-2S/4Fe-4S cluster protein (DUF4445 family)
MKHFKITFRPAGKTAFVPEGMSILEAAAGAGIVLNTACGGKGICGKCAVFVLRPDEIGTTKNGKIGDAEDEVLACQYKVKEDIVVNIEAAGEDGSRLTGLKILEEWIDIINIRGKIEPDIYRKYTHAGGSEKIFGMAADIGTTTVVVKLIDMKSGDCIATQSAINPQTRFGDDVISRISYAGTTKGLGELHRLIVDCLNELTGALCRKSGIDRKEIYEASVVGNTAMNHLFLKMSVKGLGQAPYKAYNLEAQQLYPSEIGLQINPHGNIYAVAGIGSFVGSDTTAAALATGTGEADKKTLLVDIGTNSEVVLGDKDRLLAASCAAGPAFEGARISRGSRAVEGAIEAVEWNGRDLTVKVIGSQAANDARSICGSGLIDALAVLVELGIIDSTGRIAGKEGLKENLSRLITEEDGQAAVLIARGQKEILLTQKDIRQLQLAKAAIRAGIRILQRKLGLNDEDIEQIFLAGAFGNFLRKESALRIGLLPNLPLERIHFTGNAACSGAEMTLLSSRERFSSSELARRIECVETAKEADFEEVFAKEMHF